MNALILKASAALALMPLSLDAVRRPVEARIGSLQPRGLTAVFAGSRVLVSVLAFVVLRLRLPSDPAHYYADFGRAVLGGGSAPGSPYSPGFNYLMAALLWLFHSPLSFVALMICAEIAAFDVTMRVLQTRDRPLAISTAALWLVNPISLFNVALGGQDEALILLASAGVIWAMATRRDVVAGTLVAIGVLLSKILAVFAGLPLLAVPADRKAGALTTAVLMAVAIVVLILAGVPVLGFLNEAGLGTVGNVWALVALVSTRLNLLSSVWMLGVAILAIVLAVLVMRRRPVESLTRQFLRVMGTAGCLFLLLSPKAFPSYLLMFLPGILFLLLMLPARHRAALILVFLPATVVESSFWFALVPYGDALPLRLSGRVSLAVVDTVLVAGYAVLAWRGLTLGNAPPVALPRVVHA